MRLFDAPAGGEQDVTYAAIRGRSDRDHYRSFLEAMWARFEPYADDDFPTSIQAAFESRYWEMYLGCSLLRLGKGLVARRGRRGTGGPDLLLHEEGTSIGIEAIAPDGGSGPDSILEPPMGEVYTVPDEAITLRYSSAIEAKRRQYDGWRQRGSVDAGDPFVIAVNSGRLPYGLTDVYPPRVCKALFPLGAEYVTIQGGEAVGGGFHYRPSLRKSSGTNIPTTIFTDPCSASVSAVLYSAETIGRRYDPRLHHDIDRFGNNLVLIHNPMATNPIRRGWLGVGLELYAENNQIHTIEYADSEVDRDG
jgi:hypothetical protein